MGGKKTQGLEDTFFFLKAELLFNFWTSAKDRRRKLNAQTRPSSLFTEKNNAKIAQWNGKTHSKSISQKPGHTYSFFIITIFHSLVQ